MEKNTGKKFATQGKLRKNIGNLIRLECGHSDSGTVHTLIMFALSHKPCSKVDLHLHVVRREVMFSQVCVFVQAGRRRGIHPLPHPQVGVGTQYPLFFLHLAPPPTPARTKTVYSTLPTPE